MPLKYYLTKAASIIGFAGLLIWFLILVRDWAVGPGHNLIFGLRSFQLDVVSVALFAAAAATGGWITAAAFSRSNSVKQHTMSVLTQVRLSPEMNKRIKDFYGEYPQSSVVPIEALTGESLKKDWYNSAVYLLNYYEFLAVALRHGDLHKPLLRDCIRSQFLVYFKKVEAIVEQCREEDPRVISGDVVKEKSRIYKEIIALRKEWQ